jgi:hypothetical protein
VYLTLLLGLGIAGFSLLILPVLLPIISLFREINLGSAVTVSAMLGVLILYIFTDGFSSPISYLLLGVLLAEVSGRRFHLKSLRNPLQERFRRRVHVGRRVQLSSSHDVSG